ncbi:hypothetical protein EDF35_0023 [Rathayibacter sp. PhB151]|uniref:hypothetical protein n=1 Tax=Rathayibacter sp. PhB151 TaxID=2485189 RepID=UPI001062DC46|nr:hypothetical protein [Rathayibacter sp. PhB151]TDX82289.1 hypothetical protein EDF35_0023 [Rathayibacter sp. PhB151]
MTEADCTPGRTVVVSWKTFDVAAGIVLQATRLPAWQRDELQFSGERKHSLLALMMLTRSEQAHFKNDDVVEVTITDGPSEPSTPAEIRPDHHGGRRLRTTLPPAAARIVRRLLRATVLHHRWPELHFTTGFTAVEVSAAIAEIFGRPDPAIEQLAAAERASGEPDRRPADPPASPPASAVARADPPGANR